MVTAALAYETEDSSFADACVDALEEQGIPSYRTGGSVMGGSSPRVCVYVRSSADLAKANAVLIKLGAAVDMPLKLPSRGVLALIALAVGLLVFFVAVNFK
jgi:hypothetical protein